MIVTNILGNLSLRDLIMKLRYKAQREVVENECM